MTPEPSNQSAMGLGRIVLVCVLVLLLMSPHMSESAPSRQKRESLASFEEVLPPRLISLMPHARPILGHSFAGGVKSLSPPFPDQDEGIPDRKVSHVPFADVNHDGTRDVMELDLDMQEGHPTYGFKGTLNLSTLDGSSGRVVGRYELPFHSGVPFVVPARVGPRGVRGAFIFLTRFISTTEALTSQLEVYAISGNGRELWKREWISTSTSIATGHVAATDVAVPMDLLEHRGGATDILLGIYDYAGPVLSMTPVAVSGTDGSSRSFDRVTVPWLEGTPTPVGAPDLDGDGGDDVLTLDTSGLETGIMATSSGSGEQLWHNESVATGRGTMVAEVDDTAGDRTADFVLGAPLRLFDGADGDVVWKRKGGWYVLSHADVDGEGTRDILSASAFFRERRFGADLYVVTSRGRRLGHTRYTAPRSGDGLSWVIPEEAGDLDRDRVPDAFLHLLHYGWSGENVVEKRSAISGRSSRRLAQASDVFALGSSVGGDETADLLRAERLGASYRFTALDGVSGRALWSRRVKVPRIMNLSFHPWAAGGSGRERDVAVSFFSPREGRGFLLDGRTGRVVWHRRLRP